MAIDSVTVNEDNSGEAADAIRAARERALEEIGLLAEGYAKELCPVDTGRLRNSITHVGDGGSEYVGTNVEYGPYVELGTSRAPAQPFLRPAAQDHAEQYRRVISDALSK